MGKIADATRNWAIGQEQRRQLLAFDVELTEANEKVRRLDAQILNLEKKVSPLEKEVARLEKRVEEELAKAARAAKLGEFKASKDNGNHGSAKSLPLSEEKVKILMALAALKVKSGIAPDDADIGKYLKISQIRAGYILRELAKDQFIYSDYHGDWYIGTPGEDYLVEHGHVG